MKLRKSWAVSLSFFLLMTGCSDTEPNNNDAADFSLLNENEFLYKIDRISEMPDVQFPGDDLQENNYEEINNGTLYNVNFSADGQIVIIEPGSIQGQKTSDGNESKFWLYLILDGLRITFDRHNEMIPKPWTCGGEKSTHASPLFQE